MKCADESLVASGRSKEGARAILIACGANIALTLFMIPRWGISGSALASSLAQWALFIFGYAHAANIHAPPARQGLVSG